MINPKDISKDEYKEWYSLPQTQAFLTLLTQTRQEAINDLRKKSYEDYLKHDGIIDGIERCRDLLTELKEGA